MHQIKCNEEVDMKKEQRHQLIIEILEQQMIHTQEELLQQLKLRGVTATQATISRDLNDLKVIKATTENGEKQLKLFTVDEMKTQEDQLHLHQLIEEMVTKVDRVQFMTIIHTQPDSAQMVSALVDDMDIPEKVASLAGFDTVVIISRSEAEAQKIEAMFKEYMV